MDEGLYLEGQAGERLPLGRDRTAGAASRGEVDDNDPPSCTGAGRIPSNLMDYSCKLNIHRCTALGCRASMRRYRSRHGRASRP